MPHQAVYPVAIIGDGEMEVHRSFDSIIRSVESYDFGSVIVVDSHGNVFSLVLDEYDGLLERIFSVLGETRRCRMVPFAGSVAADLVAAAKVALTAAESTGSKN